jgi:hypothetical protein
VVNTGTTLRGRLELPFGKVLTYTVGGESATGETAPPRVSHTATPAPSRDDLTFGFPDCSAVY